jgi:hypothetical protein
LVQARGRPEEAARDVRALLDLLRENKAPVQYFCAFQNLLRLASLQLKIFDPELGEVELIKSMAAEVAKLREMAGKAELQQRPGDA